MRSVKRLAMVEVKAADRGEVTAIFSTFNEVDGDGDVTLPGAFTDGAEVPISAYQHTSWTGALPVGKGVIRADGRRAWVEAQFFLMTQGGRDTFEVVKRLGDLGQWSYGYDPVDAEPGTWKGRPVRFLKRLQVHEVSPVLRGSGIGVTTLDAKDDLDPATRAELAAIAAPFHLRDDMDREYARYVRTRLEVT
jgi:Caudovirus prohead serine protease